MNTKKGFTLIELLVVLSVLAIIVTIAVPGMGNFLENNKLRGATSQIYSDLQFARSESIKRNSNISVSVTSNGETAWCYGLSENPGCDCAITDPSDINACTLTYSGASVLKIAHSTDYTGIKLNSPNGTNQTVATFNPTRGLATTTGSIILQSGHDLETHIDVSVLGKISTCTPAGAGTVTGYSLC